MNMRKKLLLLLLLFLLAGCGTAGSEIDSDFTVKEESTFHTEEPQPDIAGETEPTVTTTALLTTTEKTTTTTATTTTEAATIALENAENGGNEITWEGKYCYLTLRRPLSEEELDILSDFTKIEIILCEPVDCSVLARLAPLESLRIECKPTGESFELIGVSELLCADIEAIYIGGGNLILDLSGVQNDKALDICFWSVILRSDSSTSFPSLDQFSATHVKLENSAPFSPFATAKTVYLFACTLNDINTIRVFSEVENLTLYDGDTSELNVLQDFPYLTEIALYGSPPRICSIDALKNLPAIESIHYGFTCFTEEEEALLKEWYPDCYLHVLYAI